MTTLKDKKIIIKIKYKSVDDGWGHYKFIKDEIKGFYADDVKEAFLEFDKFMEKNRGNEITNDIFDEYNRIFGNFTYENNLESK